MPITGRGLAGSGLMGAGEALQQYAAQGIQRRQLADQRAFELYKLQQQEDAKRQDAQAAAQDTLIKSLLEHPENAGAMLQMAPYMRGLQGVNLTPLQQAVATQGAEQVTQRMNTLAKPDDAPADLGVTLSRATGRDYGSLPLQPALDLQRFGGEQPDRPIAPELQTVLTTALTRTAQLRQAQQDEIARKGQEKQVEAYSTKTGEAQGAYDTRQLSADTDAAIERAKIMAGLTPEVTGAKADQAQQVATATALGQTTPAVIAGQARLAGAKRAAEEQAAAGVKYDPANMTREIQLARDKAQADADVKRDAATQASIDQTADAGKQLVMQLVPLQDLYARAMKGDARAWSQYRDLSGQLAPLIAKASGYHGSAGTAELETVSSAIPGTSDYLFGTADAKWNYLRGLATTGPILNAQLPKDASVQDYMTAVQRLVDAQKKQPASARALSPTSAPATPSAPAAPLGLGRPLSVVTPAGWAPPSTAATHVFNPTTGRAELK